MSLGGQTVTVVNDGQATGYDGVGDPVYDARTLTVVRRCSLQQLHSSREIDVNDVTIERARLFAPSSAPLAATSVVVNGIVSSWPLSAGDDTDWYRVDGEPAIWTDLNGVANHIECYLRKEAG